MTLKDDSSNGDEPSSSHREVWVDDEDEEEIDSSRNDPIFASIQEQISRNGSLYSSCSTLASEAFSTTDGVQYSDKFLSIPYGFQPKAAYEHSKKNTDIIGVTYNGRTRQFLLLDSKGITLWSKDALNELDAVERPLQYPKYEYRLVTNIIYARKYNVYFALGKDFALKVLNREFQEICHVRSDLSSILFMIFNPVRDELITGGVAGTKIWSYKQVTEKMWTEIKHMANYKLILKTELKNVGGSWVKRVDLDLIQQHLYCCSDMDLYAYDMEGKMIFKFMRAHSMSITGCVYSQAARLLVTASVDTEVKVWSITGGLVHTFRGHARAVSNVLPHPETSMLILTSSLDGTVRMWSLETMDCLYSITMSSEGILWMGMTDDNFLYAGSLRTVTLWSLNRVALFWATARNKLTRLALTQGENKTTRVLSFGNDSSMRVFSRLTKKNLSTVLPPPILSPRQEAHNVAYNRVYSVAYMLINPHEMWLYTTRTDPACRIAVWDVFKIQQELLKKQDGESVGPGTKYKPAFLNKGPSHRATLDSQGNEGIAECTCLCYLNSHAQVWTEDEGFVCPIQHVYLLFGLSDGRILFMDPVVIGKKYFEFKVNKDAVLEIKHDPFHNTLMTMCNLGSIYHIQVWSLPELGLLHEVFTPSDLVGYIRLNSSIVTAHKSGNVVCHELLSADDNPLALTFRPKYDCATSVTYDAMKADHNGPVVAIDACPKLEIFCTCSGDGIIKVWQENKVLLTEINLEESLCAACFLNDRGDLLVGFKNHIFFIDSKKVCPMFPKSDTNDEEFEKESDIYEDPAVRYEGVLENPDPVNLKSYLVPFDIDFSKDFIEGKKPLIPDKGLDGDLDNDSESGLSCAPTDIYMSPSQSPGRLSLVDLTLDSATTKYDLRKQMALMLQGKPALMGPASSGVRFADDEAADEEMKQFEFPEFGVSPGPTPSPSTPSVCTPSSFDVSDGGESSEAEEQLASNEFTPISKPKESTSPTKIVTPKAIKESVTERTSMKDKLDSIRVDSKSVIQQAARNQAKVSDHEHVTQEDLKLLEEMDASRSGKREIKKKEAKSERKRPRTAEKRAKRKAMLDEEKVDNIHEPESAVSITTLVMDDDITEVSNTSAIKPVINKKVVSKNKRKEETDSDDREQIGEETRDVGEKKYNTKPVPKSKIEISPSKVGAGGKTGVDTTQRKRVGGSRRQMIEALPTSTDDEQVSGTAAQMIGTDTTDVDDSVHGVKIQDDFSEEDLLFQTDQSATLSRPTSADSGESLERPSSCSHMSDDPATPSTSSDQPDYITVHDNKGEQNQGPNVPSEIKRTGKVHGKLKEEKYGVLQNWLSTEEPVGQMDGAENEEIDTENAEEDLMDSLDEAGVMLNNLKRTSVTKSILRAKSASSTRPSSSIKVGFKDSSGDGETEGRRQSYSRADTPASRASTALFGTQSQQDGSVGGDGLSVQRSWSPTIYSDYGSEWTVPFSEDPLLPAFKSEEERRAYMYNQRSASAFAGRPCTPEDGEQTKKQRPHTAHVFPHDRKELEKMFEESLEVYRGSPGSPEYIPNLYQNEGNKFDSDYHYRLIERHHLLRMQRELRAQSANEKRKLLQLRKREKQKGLHGHENCENPKYLEKNKTDAMLQMLQEMLAVDSTSKGKQRRDVTGHPSIPRTRTQSARPGTSRVKHSITTRPKTASHLVCQPGYSDNPEQVSFFHPAQDIQQHKSQDLPYNVPIDMIHTTGAERTQSVMSNRPQSAAALHKSELSTELPFRFSITIKKKEQNDPSDTISMKSAPASASRKERPKSSSQNIPVVSIQNRCKLKEDKLSPSFIYSTQHNKQKTTLTEIDLKELDPRNPSPLYRRLPSKSIPSKCSQYILVSPKKKSHSLSVTPLEEQLILDRFPGWREKWIPEGPVYTRQKPFQKMEYCPQSVT